MNNKNNRMRIKQLLVTSFFLLLCTVKGFSQEYNCDIKQLKVNTYQFVTKNLDSIKKHTPNEIITAVLEFGEKGELKKSIFYAAYGEKAQKEVKVWKGLAEYVKTSFSLCPDSHFYDNRDYVLNTTFKIPLVKAVLAKTIKQVEAEPGYVAAGTGQKDIPKDSKYILDIKKLVIGKRVVEPLKKEGSMDSYNSKMIKLTDLFHIAFEIVKVPGNKTNYIKYKLYEKVSHKGVIITSEGWRPIVDGKASISVTGKRDTQEGVKKVDFNEVFDLEMTISFK